MKERNKNFIMGVAVIGAFFGGIYLLDSRDFRKQIVGQGLEPLLVTQEVIWNIEKDLSPGIGISARSYTQRNSNGCPVTLYDLNDFVYTVETPEEM